MDVLILLLIGAFVFFLVKSASGQSSKGREKPTDSSVDEARRISHKSVSQAPLPRLPAPASVIRTLEVVPPTMSPRPSAQQSITSHSAGAFHVTYLLDSNGRPIGSDDRDAWLLARRHGVTATDVKKIVKLNGDASKQRPALLNQKVTGAEGPRLAAFQHGIDREPFIAAWVAKEFGIVHNSYVCSGSNARHLATPDGIGQDVVAEIKTSVKPLSATLGMYRDQLQWQLHVTQSARALFVVENRHTFQLEVRWVYRDEQRIRVLEEHANRFIAELDSLLVRSDNSIPDGYLASFPQAKLHDDHESVVALQAVLEQLESPLLDATFEAVPDESPLEVHDEEEDRRWTPMETSRLLFLYDEGASLLDLAHNFNATNRAVVFELTRQVLNSEGTMVDPSACNFGAVWSPDEVRALMNAYFDGIWLPSLARDLARDQLGIAFKLFEYRLPSVPNHHCDLSWLERPDVTSDNSGASFGKQVL